jgi:hypothetical protein
MTARWLASIAASAAVSMRDRDITVAVRRHCKAIGCDCSNTQAAIAWALRSPGHTLQAIREGRARAEKLRARQPVSCPKPSPEEPPCSPI